MNGYLYVLRLTKNILFTVKMLWKFIIVITVIVEMC